MSFSLQVVDGDLAVNGGEFTIVYGLGKLKQDIDLWLRERYGIDRFHPQMGSTLEDYIGSIIDSSTHANITNEVERVLNNYSAVQVYNIQASPQKYSLTELLTGINNINTQISYDLVTVDVSVSTAAGTSTSVTAVASA